MSYRPNQRQQLSIFDRSLRLTERERKCLEKSRAKVFSDEIFPAIDEDRFRVLYSETASRPNTPVNVIVGALIIKELFDLSDDEVVENLMLDVHYQYALHTTSYEEQPLSDKILSHFRRRCYEYERLSGVDLFYDCVCDLSGKNCENDGDQFPHQANRFSHGRGKHQKCEPYRIVIYLCCPTGTILPQESDRR